jgi:hypothetical protein
MHSGRNIQRKESRFGVSGGKLARAIARAAARIHDELGRIFDVIEAGQHAVQHFVLQDRCLIVVWRSALERFPHLALIDYMLVVHFIGRSG